MRTREEIRKDLTAVSVKIRTGKGTDEDQKLRAKIAKEYSDYKDANSATKAVPRVKKDGTPIMFNGKPALAHPYRVGANFDARDFIAEKTVMDVKVKRALKRLGRKYMIGLLREAEAKAKKDGRVTVVVADLKQPSEEQLESQRKKVDAKERKDALDSQIKEAKAKAQALKQMKSEIRLRKSPRKQVKKTAEESVKATV